MIRGAILGSAISLVLGLNLGCATTPDNPHFKTMPEDEIQGTIRDNTQNRKVYDGFMNNLDVSATLTNSSVAKALLDQGARIYQWDENTFANEKSKGESFRAAKTEIFLSFFVPDRKWDDLHKSTTKWKIFLDVGGRRFEGKAERWKTPLVEVSSFYPHHTRWGTPYKVSFDVPTRDVENLPSKLTLTGPVGVVTFEFAADTAKASAPESL